MGGPSGDDFKRLKNRVAALEASSTTLKATNKKLEKCNSKLVNLVKDLIAENKAIVKEQNTQRTNVRL